MYFWREIQKKNFTDWKKLALFLELSQEKIKNLLPTPHFPLNIPLRLAQKIQKNNLNDPLLKQFIPLQKEMNINSAFLLDPVSDATFRKAGKLLHKYKGRALLVTTSACAMHCRYCFRQNFEYKTDEKTFEKELQILKRDPSITEIILSGGDPLSLGDTALSFLIKDLENIPHLKKLRIHTRFPIGIPERITEQFLSILAILRLQTIFVIHTNHIRELDQDVLFALKKIQKLGIPVLNQTVLLKGVNDSVETLKQLFEHLTDNGIIPYYLHQLDQVQGAAHFEVPIEVGKTLIQELQKNLPGYAVPRYVQEIPGHLSKTII